MNEDGIQADVHDIVVPDLHDTAGIFAPEAARWGLVAEYGPPRPETAPETARRLASQGMGRVRVHGGSNDSRACAVLVRALLRVGLRAEVQLHAGDPGADLSSQSADLARSRGLHVLHIDETMRAGPQAWPELAKACERALQLEGAQAVRLQIPTLRRVAEESGRRASPLAESLGLQAGAWRDFLLELIATGWPLRQAAWVSLLQADALAINPIENVYAGQHLRDRNRDLMVNIL